MSPRRVSPVDDDARPNSVVRRMKGGLRVGMRVGRRHAREGAEVGTGRKARDKAGVKPERPLAVHVLLASQMPNWALKHRPLLLCLGFGTSGRRP